MEYPFGHQHHHHGGDRREEDYPPHAPPTFNPTRPREEDYLPHAPPTFNPPRPHPPSYYGYDEPPPPPQVTHAFHGSHVGGDSYHPPPPPPVPDYYVPPPPPRPSNYSDSPSYPPPPLRQSNYSDSPSYPPPPTDIYSSVQHVSHESEINPPHHHRPHMPSFMHHHIPHESSGLDYKPAVRVFCKAETNYSLTIRDGKVILVPSDPSDPLQHWIKDEKYSTRVKDEEGFPSFALVNKATGQAIKHSIGATHPVQLIPYNPDVLDESILWTQSKDLGDGFRTIRMVNNIRLNVDAFNGDKNHGGVHNGTTVVLWEWKKGDNQRWTIVPY